MVDPDQDISESRRGLLQSNISSLDLSTAHLSEIICRYTYPQEGLMCFFMFSYPNSSLIFFPLLIFQAVTWIYISFLISRSYLIGWGGRCHIGLGVDVFSDDEYLI